MPETPSLRPHLPMGFWGGAGLFYFLLRELLINLPNLWRTRREYRKALRTVPHAEPWIVWVSDILDEVNGVALASRAQMRELRRQGHNAFLFGVAYHTRQPRREDVDQALILAPACFSVGNMGYPESELAVVRLSAYLDFLREYPVDLVEFESPPSFLMLQCLIASKIVGVQTLWHYRWEIFTYFRHYVKNPAGLWFMKIWTHMCTRWTGPVIVPSKASGKSVAALLGIPPDMIHKLPRGVNLSAFHPRLRDRALWTGMGIPHDGFLLLYSGRLSVEKNLDALVEAFLGALKIRPDLRLILLGDGPSRLELESRLRPTGRAHFTGFISGETLGRAYASADLFVFPSLSDTFGNSVTEALASGLPCLVSDEGGPQEIIVPGTCGEIFRHREPLSLRDRILSLAGDPERLARYRAAARIRAEEFTFENSARAFWNLYVSIWKH